ncbi:MAG: CapA family protein [Acidimicrobiia bacterium]|nr:CapA family protein [Acidimicrobiia bacterium]
MRRLVLFGLLALSVVAIGLLAVRVGDGNARDRRARAADAGPSSSTRSTTTTTRPRRGSGQAVTLAFAGDTHFEGGLRSQLDRNPNGMFAPIAPTLGGADLAMVNLETAIATGGTPDPKAYNFRAPASAYEALRVAGIDVVTMANNHGRDYGPAGLSETLAAKAQTPLPVLGIGANAEEAYRPWRTEIKGQQIAVFAATDVLDDWLITPWTATDAQAGLASTKGASVDRLLAGIRGVRADTDTIVVYLHWGVEGSTCPSPRQQELALLLVDAGADIIVGSHTHRVMTGGRHGAAFVDYGLGNFAFYNESGASGVTGVLKLTVTGRDVDAYEWIPARIQGGIPHLITGVAADTDRSAFTSRQSCAGLTP